MSRLNLRGASAAGLEIRKGLTFGHNIELLAAQKVLTTEDHTLQFLDPGAATRDVLLPAEASSKGLMFIISNTGAGVEDLVVKEDSDTTTIVTVTFPEMAIVVCDGTTWRGLTAGAT